MNNLLGDLIKRYRQEHSLSLREFALKCNISHTYLDCIEKGFDFRTGKRVALTNATIKKLAKALELNENLIFSLSLDEKNEAFDFYFFHEEREPMKMDSWKVLNDSNSTTDEKYSAALFLFKVYFSRSIEGANFDTNHVSFNKYCSMLLNQDYWKSVLPSTIYDKLVEKYGTSRGIEEGKTYYIITKLSRPSFEVNRDKSPPLQNYLKDDENVFMLARDMQKLNSEDLKILQDMIEYMRKNKS